MSTRRASASVTRTIGLVVRWAEPGLVILVLLLVWELLSRTEVLPRADFPPVTEIFRAFAEDLFGTDLWRGVRFTMTAWLIGMTIVVAVGVSAGMLLGASKVAYRLSYLTLEFVRTLPSIAALPLLLFIYGVGQELTVALIVLAALWPMLLQTMYGMHDIDPVMRATVRVYGVPRWRRFLLVDLPSCLPYIATGVRISGAFALIFAIAASLVVGGEGLGAEMSRAASAGDRPLVYARVLATGLLGLAVTIVLTHVERRMLPWHPSQRTERV